MTIDWSNVLNADLAGLACDEEEALNYARALSYPYIRFDQAIYRVTDEAHIFPEDLVGRVDPGPNGTLLIRDLTPKPEPARPERPVCPDCGSPWPQNPLLIQYGSDDIRPCRNDAFHGAPII